MEQVAKDRVHDVSLALLAKDVDAGLHLGKLLIGAINGFGLHKLHITGIDPERLTVQAGNILEVGQHKGFLESLRTGE